MGDLLRFPPRRDPRFTSCTAGVDVRRIAQQATLARLEADRVFIRERLQHVAPDSELAAHLELDLVLTECEIDGLEREGLAAVVRLEGRR